MLFHSTSVGIGDGQSVEPQTIEISRSSASRSDDLINRKGNPSNNGDASIFDFTASLRASKGIAQDTPIKACCEGELGTSIFGRIVSALARLEDHWIGDLIGVVSLFAIGWSWMLLGYAWGLE